MNKIGKIKWELLLWALIKKNKLFKKELIAKDGTRSSI